MPLLGWGWARGGFPRICKAEWRAPSYSAEGLLTHGAWCAADSLQIAQTRHRVRRERAQQWKKCRRDTPCWFPSRQRKEKQTSKEKQSRLYFKQNQNHRSWPRVETDSVNVAHFLEAVATSVANTPFLDKWLAFHFQHSVAGGGGAGGDQLPEGPMCGCSLHPTQMKPRRDSYLGSFPVLVPALFKPQVYPWGPLPLNSALTLTLLDKWYRSVFHTLQIFA